MFNRPPNLTFIGIFSSEKKNKKKEYRYDQGEVKENSHPGHFAFTPNTYHTYA